MNDTSGNTELQWFVWASRIITGTQIVLMLLIITFVCLLFNQYLGTGFDFRSVVYGWGVIAFSMVYAISFPVAKQVDRAIDAIVEDTEGSNTQE